MTPAPIACRRIDLADVPSVAAFAAAGMQLDRYPMRVSEEKIAGWVRTCMDPKSPHFHLAAFNNGLVVGAIAAYVVEMPFFERCEAHVVMCRATQPGAGRILIRKMNEWFEGNMMVRRVIFPLEENADPRQALLLARFGFVRAQTNVIKYKG